MTRPHSPPGKFHRTLAERVATMSIDEITLARRRLCLAGQGFLVQGEQLERRTRARWRLAVGDGHECRPPRRREDPPYR